MLRAILAVAGLVLLPPMARADDDFSATLYVKKADDTELWNSATGTTGTGWDDYNWIYKYYDYESYTNDPETRRVTWGSFANLQTVQFIIPAAVQDSVANVYIAIDMPGQQRFRVFYQDQFLGDYASGETFSLEGLLGGDRDSGDPLHFTIYALDDDGVKVDWIWAAWVSFRHEWGDASSGHYCHLSQEAAIDTENFKSGFDSSAAEHPGDSNNCQLRAPQYRCWNEQWEASTDGVKYVQFVGPLVDMADGQLINIHLDDDVDVDIPLTNNFVTHTVTPSNACNNICKMLVDGQSMDQWDAIVEQCTIESSALMAKDGLGQVRVSGYGRINGWSLQDGSAGYGGGRHFDNDQSSCDPKPQSGTQAALQGCEFVIMAGLLHLAQSDSVTASAGSFPVDIYEVAVAYGAAIGDGSVLVNPQYVTMESTATPANNAAKLFDVKTPGTFVDAADGPNLFGYGSQVTHCYLQHADDTVKISASGGVYYRNTLLHGNTGSAMLLGNFGLGLFDNEVKSSKVDGVFVHYIWQDGDDNQGANTHTGVLGMQTCLAYWGDITLSDITIENVYVPDLGEGRTRVNRAFSLGALDPGFEGSTDGFCAHTNENNLNNVLLSNLVLTKWQIFTEPMEKSLLFSNKDDNDDRQRGYLVLDNIQFYDLTCGQDFDCIKASAVKIYHPGTSDAYFVCGTDTDTYDCMDAGGAYWQQDNMCGDQNGGNSGCQNVEWFEVDVAGKLMFPWNDMSNPWRRRLNSLRGSAIRP